MTTNLRDQLQATLSGTHTLERELGGGGMSKVFVAEETRLGRKVVIKVLSPELAQGISVDRFEREIKTVAALQQANIVPVITAGDTNGLPYYTMPFVEGESLRARLARGPLAVTEVIGVLRDVSKALAYAHQRGVVHRDIKPDNVLLSGGTAVVTDFGIAKAISASRTQSGAGATLTQIGTSIGTPAYMAPEQAAGDPGIDHRADIYSLGAMAYELLSGQAVFANRTPQRMLAAHMGEAPKSITEFRGDLPPALADLVMQCLAKEADQRPQQAGDIARVLESITSGSGMQSLPPVLIGGPGMLKKALAIYAAAFVAVAILAKAAIVGIGLPDWVFPGSLIVMALGLPVILWTGYVQRVARRALTMTPTFTPGGTPSTTAHGTIATMALKAAPHVSWYRTARGGVYAFGTFVAVIGAFMAMRQFGIGPFGSLLASGALSTDDRVLLTDFSVSSGDSTVGRVVSDAVRAGLADSRALIVVTPAEMGAALRRMQRPASERLNLALARQVAQREGIKAIIDGDVASVAGSFILTVRLVTADSGKELTSHRATAAGADKLIDAADDVARQLRSKVGESLRRVHAAPPLAEATTASLEALRKYSEGARANDVDRDYLKAIGLLRQAVAIDSNFAEGWRKLGVALSNQGLPRSQSDSAITRAYQLRDRLGDAERDRIVAYYFLTGPGRDRAKAAEAYESLLARGDSSGNMMNLANIYRDRREFARAESLYRASNRRAPGQLVTTNLLFTLQIQQKQEALDSAIAAARKAYPDSPDFPAFAMQALLDRGQLAAYERALDSARRATNPRDPSDAFWQSAGLAGTYGQVGKQLSYQRQARRIDSTVGRRRPPIEDALSVVFNRVDVGLPSADAVRDLEAMLTRYPLDRMPVSERPYFGIAYAFAMAGRVDRAKAILAQYRAAVTDSARLREDQPSIQGVQGAIALAERRWADAAAELRLADRRPDGPANVCVECLPERLMYLFSEAGQADSAIAQYGEYRRTPYGSRKREGPDVRLGGDMMERMARMYEMKGDTANAAEFYRQFIELWKNADPELQPRVTAARERLKKLTPVEKPR